MERCAEGDQELRQGDREHVCGEPAAIDEYIALQDEQIQPLLRSVRSCIRRAAPQAQERISWRMPTFWQGENLIHFAAFKNHLGLFPGDLTGSPFTERLAGYHTSKGTIRFPYNKPIDYALIQDITVWRVSCAEAKEQAKAQVKA